MIYVVTDVNPTIVLFDLAGGPFGTLGDSTVVTTADLTLMPRMTAAPNTPNTCLLYTSPSPRD